MNIRLPSYLFSENEKYRDNYDRIFGSKKEKMSEYETHVRRCPICRLATNNKELCEIGKIIRKKNEAAQL